MLTRRKLLHSLAALPFVGPSLARLDGSRAADTALAVSRDYFNELGLRTFINAAGTYTALTGSLMREEVTKAWSYAADRYVELDAIQDAVGRRLSELLDCEAATITSGAASAMTIGTAGILTGLDEEKAVQLPDLTGMKSEVIIQKAHNVGYVHAVRNTGVKMIYVETRQELLDAINEQTAMLLFINAYNFDGQVRDEEFVAIGKEYGVPTFNDCAADVPPVDNLFKYQRMGFDLVCFSGGKGLRGPQSAGLLLGRADLIAAARLHAPPRGNTVGRGMKVNKEEILAMLIAVESYLERDHEKEWQLWEDQIDLIRRAAVSVDGVEAKRYVPEIANHVPSIEITWDRSAVAISASDVREALRNGHPSIEVKGGENTVNITTWMMRPGEERTVARRVHEILASAANS